jgi:hypothetical protein
MPPRYAYWTILIDNTPTAFRAREQEELLPTIAQLRRTNANVVMKWFARGRIWDSPEAEREAQRRPPAAGSEKRGRDWRPGGAHKDPRDRFKKKKHGERHTFGTSGESRPVRDKPAWAGRPAGPPRGDRPWQNKSNRPPSGPPRGDRPWTKSSKPPSDAPRRDRPWGGKVQGHVKPWRDKPGGPPRGDRPWRGKPHGRPFVPRDQRPPHKRRDDDPDKK